LVRYNSASKTGEAEGDVRIADSSAVLFAPSATYDSRAKTSYFTEGARLVEDDATLTSRRGTYNSRTKVATFDDDVRLTDSTTVLTSLGGRVVAHEPRRERIAVLNDAYVALEHGHVEVEELRGALSAEARLVLPQHHVANQPPHTLPVFHDARHGVGVDDLHEARRRSLLLREHRCSNCDEREHHDTRVMPTEER
ncbi:MAG: OstA-like protein, partial [Bacteroidota bacterium]